MRAASSIARSLRSASIRPRAMHARFASTLLKMPAMSPTMTEGGVAGWKVNEGQAFNAGDVILEVETDKATIDVEASDDGVMGKILVQAGSKNVPVGAAIAVLAEEGDDLANLEIPADTPESAIPHRDEAAAESAPAPAAPAAKEQPAAPAQAIHHVELDASKPVFPSVSRLLHNSTLTSEQVAQIKPSGRHGMLTKGDVLAAMGKISNPYGSAEKMIKDPMGASGKRASEPKTAAAGAGAAAAAPKPEPPLDGPALRRLIAAGLAKAAAPKPAPKAAEATASARTTDAEFDDLLADYFPARPAPAAAPVADGAAAPAPKDEFAGLY